MLSIPSWMSTCLISASSTRAKFRSFFTISPTRCAASAATRLFSARRSIVLAALSLLESLFGPSRSVPIDSRISTTHRDKTSTALPRAPMGLLISCATPATRVPSDAIFSCIINRFCISRRSVISRMIPCTSGSPSSSKLLTERSAGKLEPSSRRQIVSSRAHPAGPMLSRVARSASRLGPVRRSPIGRSFISCGRHPKSSSVLALQSTIRPTRSMITIPSFDRWKSMLYLNSLSRSSFSRSRRSSLARIRSIVIPT